jgi:hypothetical protein
MRRAYDERVMVFMRCDAMRDLCDEAKTMRAAMLSGRDAAMNGKQRALRDEAVT